MHGRGLKVVFDTSLWASLGDEIVPANDYVRKLSAHDLAASTEMAPLSLNRPKLPEYHETEKD